MLIIFAREKYVFRIIRSVLKSPFTLVAEREPVAYGNNRSIKHGIAAKAFQIFTKPYGNCPVLVPDFSLLGHQSFIKNVVGQYYASGLGQPQAFG